MTEVQRDVLLVAACALGLRLFFLVVTSGTYDYDEFVILLLSRDFAHGATPYHTFMFFHPPGPLVLYGLVTPLTDLWWPLARILTLAVDSLSALLVWRIGVHLYGRRAGIAAGLIYAASPLALVSAVRVGQDPLVTAFGLGGLALLLGSPTRRVAALAGVCLALAVWTKYPALTFLPVYVLAAPRRSPICLLSAAAALALLFLPFAGQLHALYDQTVTFQRTRWTMDTGQRLETALLFWWLVNPLALLGLMRRRNPPWLLAGFVIGGVYLFASQVYYHYFVPIVPFGALLAAPYVAQWRGLSARLVASLCLVATLAWGLVMDLGGASPLFVTAAHLSEVSPAVTILERSTGSHDAVLADRYEYAYLARRPALAHYFWNVGVLVDAGYLERRLPGAGAVVLSQGASSGYPAGFTAYLDAHYKRLRSKSTTIWLTSRPL